MTAWKTVLGALPAHLMLPVFLMFAGALHAAQPAAEHEDAPEAAVRRGSLKDLPSKPTGAHLAKIKALGDNEWLDLGSPQADPKWGKARGRSWAPRAPYAPDLRGAFFFGEGPHGRVKPDGHYMDDLWFYDIHQHRWICVYPGIHAGEGYAKIRINEEGFEVGPDGYPLPIAQVGHAYCAVTYDTHRKCFMSAPTFQHYWKKAIKGRKEALDANRNRLVDKKHTSPWIYDTVEGNWDCFKTRAPRATCGAGAVLIYVPTVQKAFGYERWSSRMAWYDPQARNWAAIEPKGDRTPWHMDVNACYDSKRDRIYLGGGLWAKPAVKEGESALWAFDVKTETFSRLEPEVNPTPTNYATNTAMMFYDSANDAVVLFYHRSKGKRVRRIYAYLPEENKWEVVSENPPQLKRRGNPTWTGFYNPELNVHFMHVANDGRDNGTMWVYRYRQHER
jgi:hypothetical protein